jgi:hypothetical protein
LAESLILYNPKDPAQARKIPLATAIPATPGWFTVAGEGSSAAIRDENGNAMNAKQTLERLRKGGWDGKTPVWFKSCASAQTPSDGTDPIAKQVSDTGSVTVRGASTGHSYGTDKSREWLNPITGKIIYGGKITITECFVDPRTKFPDPNGKWITFTQK